MIIIKTVKDYLYDKDISIEVTPEEVIYDIFKEYDHLGTLERIEKKIDFLSSLITSSADLVVQQLIQIASYECRNIKYTIKEENNDSILDNK